eukprot:SAG11_NODE_872_length_6802_cov_8.951514_6_plen_88_part_00
MLDVTACRKTAVLPQLGVTACMRKNHSMPATIAGAVIRCDCDKLFVKELGDLNNGLIEQSSPRVSSGQHSSTPSFVHPVSLSLENLR